LANVQIVRPRLGENGPPANVNGRPEIYTHNHYNIPTNHNVHINHIHIIHENIKMLALGTEAQPINKSIKITQHNMNTLCRYLHYLKTLFPLIGFFCGLGVMIADSNICGEVVFLNMFIIKLFSYDFKTYTFILHTVYTRQLNLFF
jgi:hypothetical protein